MRIRLNQRRSGILLHPTALPSQYGIGDFGPAAYTFVDRLKRSGQSYWQVLPLLIPDVVGSPYASGSAFAGNWLLISPELLMKDRLLDHGEGWSGVSDPVQYPAATRRKARMLAEAYVRFQKAGTLRQRRALAAFRRREHGWIEDWALFAALKDYFGHPVPWTRWPEPIRRRNERAIEAWKHRLASEIEFHVFVQWLFDIQWKRLKQYANQQGIAIIGDLPIFVTRDSADTWAEPKNFLLDSMGRPRLVAGVPPDYFSNRGQVWGDPLYNWDHLKRTKYRWWMRRFQRSFELYDVVRLDHFRGYVATWGVRAGSRSARRGSWHRVPGRELLMRAKRRFGTSFIAEDLGVITDEVNSLRNYLGFPGVRVLQFGFEDLGSIHALQNLSRRSVAYTGTHDNNTTRGWLSEDASHRERRRVKRLIQGGESNVAEKMIVALLRSRAMTTIVPVADVFHLGGQARFNTPGKRKGNWQWRMPISALNPKHWSALRRVTSSTGRRPKA